MEIKRKSEYTIKLTGEEMSTVCMLMQLGIDDKKKTAKQFMKEWKKTQRPLEENLAIKHEEDAIKGERILKQIGEA